MNNIATTIKIEDWHDYVSIDFLRHRDLGPLNHVRHIQLRFADKIIVNYVATDPAQQFPDDVVPITGLDLTGSGLMVIPLKYVSEVFSKSSYQDMVQKTMKYRAVSLLH